MPSVNGADIGGQPAGGGVVAEQKQNNPQYWMDDLLSSNPALKADPMLVTSLYNQFKDSSDPQQLAHSTFMSRLLDKSVDQVGLTNLYPTFQGEPMVAPKVRQPDKWWQAANTTDNLFSKAFGMIGNAVGYLPGKAIGYLTQDKGIGNSTQSALSNLITGAPNLAVQGITKGAVDLGRLATGNIGDLTAGQGLPQWSIKDPLYLGQAVEQALQVGQNLFGMADTFMANLKSQMNQKGTSQAIADQWGNLAGGMLLGGAIGGAAEAAESTTVLDAAEQAAETANAQDAQVIKNLTEKMKSEPLTAEEQAALEKAKQDLVSRDSNALHKMSYQDALDEYKGKFPTSYLSLQQELESGAITQKEFDQAIAKDISEESAPAFNNASEALNGETPIEQAAQDEIQKAKLATSDKVWQKVVEGITYPVALPLKGIGMLAKAIGSRSANITYLLGALQAQEDPQDAYTWQLAQQGKVLNEDGSTQDLGIEIANSLGIDGMWGTSVRDLVDVGLKWVVDDPIASFSRIAKESRSAYGMTGVLGKWFNGTGIKEVGDVDRAYRQYSSVRRAIDWMASHSASEISGRFSALNLSSRMLNRLGEAKSAAQVMNILEEASQSMMMADRITSMPTMGWYTYVKAGLRGETADKFATLADALASPTLPTKDIIEALEKETGADITPHDVGYAAGGVGEKAQILYSQRLRRLFSSKQMIIEGGRITDRKLIVGSARSVNGIMQFLRNSFMSDDFVRMIGDQLIRHSDNPEKWNNIYNNSMRIALYRRMLASTAHSDFGLFIDKMSSEIDSHIYAQSGVDGGSMAMDQAMVADNNDLADRVMDEDGKMTVAAVGDTQLGERMLPTERQFRQLGRFFGKVAMNTNRTGGDVFLRSTDKTFEVVRQLAETARVQTEKFLSNFKYEDRAQDFAPTLDGEDSGFKGYIAKAQEITEKAKQMLEGDELKGLTDAERYASVVKYLDGELDHARDLYTSASKRYEQIIMTRPGQAAVERAFGTGVDVPEMLKHMYGELTAVQDMGAEMKAAISSSFLSSENVEKQANYLSSTLSTAEAGEKYKQLFKEQYDYAYNRQVGERIGIGKLTVANLYKKISSGDFQIKSLGDRGFRSTFDPIVDLMQGYLNGWFKLLTLATPAWAERVVISEAMLNALRIGGHDFTESKLVQSLVKNQQYLGKVATGELERKAFRAAISNTIIGIDKALTRTLKGKEFDDFFQFVTNLYAETDGHMLGGVHAQGDLMSEDGFQSAVSNKIVGIKNGKLKTSNKMLGEGFIRRNSSDSDAGAALYESITRASRDTVFSEVARFELAKIEEEGQKIFDSNSSFYTELAQKDAYETLTKNEVDINEKTMKVQLKKSIQKQIRTLGGQSFSNSVDLIKLRSAADRHMEQFISGQPEEFRMNFQRNTKVSAKYPDLTPHQGWARTAVDHIHGLSTNVNSRDVESAIFPEILHQIANKDYQTQEELATWLRDSYQKGEPVPSAFPAHEYIPMLSSGHFNPLRKFSDYLHRGPLGRIVNTGSRDPIFVWETWQQYKKWIPLIENGTIDMGEAMGKAQSDALINMSKFVHNPMDKTIWEENMRVIAPYYFAKNQAMRRALRVAGDNFAAFEKYMKINLAVTDYVALAYNQSGIGSFTFPGSQLVMGLSNGIVNGLLAAQGLPTYGGLKGMGIEASPASPDSIIITGQMPGLAGFAENLVSMPFGPIVTIPAKLVYSQMQYRVPFIASVIKWALGPASMNSSIWSDLFPNSTAQNIYKGVYGYFNQNEVGSYLSSEIHVVGNQATDFWTGLRLQAAAMLEKKGAINAQNIRSGAAQELISYYAGRKFDQFMKNPINRADFQDDANWHTAALYAAKTLVSTGTPLSAVISSDTQVQTQLNKIALEKDAQGDYRFPTYTLQVAELLRRFPNELFGTMAHTESPFSTWNENYGSVAYVNAHEKLVKAYPYITAFLGSQVGKGSQYDPVASQIFEGLGLRAKETPSEFINNMRITHGNYQFYNVMLPEYQSLYPGTYSDGLSSEGYYAWQTSGKYYAENTNSAWGNYHYGGQAKQTAVDTYQDLQSFMKDSNAVATLTPEQKQYLPLLIDARKSWEKQYLAAAGEKSEQTALESQWYNECTTASTTPGWSQFASIITGVFQKLPPPQG